jgi:hypothetical protein
MPGCADQPELLSVSVGRLITAILAAGTGQTGAASRLRFMAITRRAAHKPKFFFRLAEGFMAAAQRHCAAALNAPGRILTQNPETGSVQVPKKCYHHNPRELLHDLRFTKLTAPI